jgi:hypothetical protein
MAIVREEMGAFSTGATKYRTDQAELVYEPGIAEWMSKFCVDIDFVRTHIDADWNFSELSKSNTKLAIELSMEFPEKAWDFNKISWD